jgi:ligand-binding sensor domain-containing protein/signal transduction histidine kinase
MSHFKTLLFFMFFVAAVCSSGTAQHNYLFTHLGLRDGLVSNQVGRIQQDAQGYIWLTTTYSLQRYDGYRFQTFRTGDGLLPQGNIRGFEIDRKNRLWLHIGDNLLGYLDPVTLKWTSVKVTVPQAWKNVGSGIFIDNSNRVMVVYPGSGFVTYDDATGEATESNNPFQLPQGWNVLHTWQDKNNNYWFGTTNGLVKFNPSNKQLSYAGHNTDNDVNIRAFSDLKYTSFFFIDKQNRRWLGSWPPTTGLSLKSLSPDGTVKEWNAELARGLNGAYHTIFGFIENSKGLWITGVNMLARYDEAEGRFQFIQSNTSGEFSIRYDLVSTMLEDREKNLWLSTDKGIYRYNPLSQLLQTRNNIVVGESLPFTAEVSDILETSSGQVLVSTTGNGIFPYDKGLDPVASNYFPGNSGIKEGMTWCLVEMNNGDVWWGAQDGWLCYTDAATGKITRGQPELVNRRTILQMEKDKEENLWLGTRGGRIIKFNPATNQWKLVRETKGSISRLVITAKQELWAATDVDGVYQFDIRSGNLIQHYKQSNVPGKSLPINGAGDLLPYNDSTMLIVSNGLNQLNTRTGDIKSLLPGAEIYNIVKDTKNNLVWCSTSRGIFGYSITNITTVYSFGEREGVDNFAFSHAASTVLKDGRIIFGNSRGIIAFHPDTLLAHLNDDKFSKVYLSEIYLNDKQLAVDSVFKLNALKFGPGNASLKFCFTTNTYQNQPAIHYMIEGLDKEWKPTSASREINLNYLPYGSYTLKAAVINQDNQTLAITSLPIEIVTPFYRTWWFLALILVALLTALYLYDLQRMKRRNELLKVRRDIATNLHTDISNTLEKINILSEMAVLKNEEDPEKSQEFLAQIKDRSSNMISAMQDMLWSISPDNDKTEKLINRLEKYVQVLNNRHSAAIEIATNESLKAQKFDMQLRYELLLLLKYSLKGLINAGVRDIRIFLGVEKNTLLYNVQFTNEDANLSLLKNFVNGKELIDKVQSIKGTISSKLGARNSEIDCRIQL